MRHCIWFLTSCAILLAGPFILVEEDDERELAMILLRLFVVATLVTTLVHAIC